MSVTSVDSPNGSLPAVSAVSIAPSSSWKAEGFSGSVPFTFVVTRTGDTSTPESVDWSVLGANPSPATAVDFVGGFVPSGTVTFAAGETSRTITVNVAGDLEAEPEEGFTVALSNPTAGLSIVTATASATIIDGVGARFIASIDPAALLSNSSTLSPIFSPDGLKVAFQGFADNLVPADTNDDPDFFVKDLVTGAIIRVSTDSAGGQAFGDPDNNSDPISFSPDSTKVVFGSSATNLVSNDTNGKQDIFVKDLVTGLITRVSTDAAGVQADNQSHQPTFSPDGTQIVFWSSATNLVSGDTNGKQDIFIKNLVTGVVTRVSTDAVGAQSNGDSDQPVFSPDGTKVAFISKATNLAPFDTNGITADLLVKDLATGAVTIVSTSSAGTQPSSAVGEPVWSPDGTKIAFSSAANSLVPNDTNLASDIFVKDLTTGTLTRVSTDAAGGQANGTSSAPVFSPDGSRVSFASGANNLVAGDTNGKFDIFVKDLTTGAIQRVTTDASGVQGDNFSFESNFSPDGRRLIVSSDAGNLVTGDTNGFADAIIADLNLVSVLATDAARPEGLSGTTFFSFTVSRAGVVTQALSVDWAVTGTGAHPADAADFVGGLPSGTVTFAAGESSKVVTLPIAGDATIEFDETFNVTLSNLSAIDFMFGTKTATGAIQNDDKLAAAIAADVASLAEGNAGTKTFTFTVTLDRAGPFTQTVDWAVTGSGANPADAADFGGVLPSGTLTLSVGETSKTISVGVSGDAVLEPDEGFKVTLANPSSGLLIGTAAASATIVNDDGASVSIAATDATKAEGDSGGTPFTFTVTLAGGSAAPLTVDWTVSSPGGRGAADAADFVGGTFPAGTLTFQPGDTGKAIVVMVAGDGDVEGADAFTVTLSNPSPGLAIGTASAAGSIENDDTFVTFTGPVEQAEGNSGSTAFVFTLVGRGDFSVARSVSWAVTGSGGNAAGANDFTGNLLPSGTVTLEIGETNKTITVLVAGDTTVEPDETFTIALSNPSVGLAIFEGSTTGTILSDDSPTVSIGPALVVHTEGDGDSTPYIFTVALSQPGLTQLTVDWSVTGSSDHPATAGDFGGTLPSGTVTFAAGETSKTITVSASGDTIVEFDEFFIVALSNPSAGLALGTASAGGDIQNEDRAKISITPLSASKAEGDGGPTAFAFTVSLDQASFADQTAQWTVTGTGANAADAADFGGTFPSGTVSFAAGETSKVVTVLVSGDTAAEFNEDFVVTLSNLTTGLQPGIASAAGTIQNDDKSVVSVTAGPGAKVEGTGGTTIFDWTVSLDRAGVASETVAWAVTGNGAHAADGADLVGGVLPSGTLTFAPGETSKTVSVGVAGDSVVEFDEDLVLTLSAPSSGLDLGTATMAATILNDDVSVASIAVQSAIKAEGNSATTPFTFLVSLNQAGVTTQTVGWSALGGGSDPADAADFGGALPIGIVTFAAGETSKLVTIQVSGDSVAEAHEIFLVTLGSPSAGLSIGAGSDAGVILDDDGAVSIAAQTAAQAERDSGITAFTFLVTMTGPHSAARSVAWAVTGTGVNAAAASDFAGGVLPSGVLSFAPGETSKVLTVNVAGDTTVEQDEGFIVTLSNPSSGLTLGTASASGTIQNDDTVVVTVATHDDAYIVQQGHPLSIAASVGVLANDQSASTATLLSGTAHGTLQLAGTSGGFSYTPAAGFSGIDSFTYHAATGGSGADGQALIYVVPVIVGTTTTLDLLTLNAEEQIAATYAAFFGRAADADGFGFWVGEFVRNLPTQGPAALFANIASSFGVSAEAKALYPFLVNPFAASDPQISSFIESVYNNLFNRGSDAAGLAYWTGQVKATLAAGQFVGSVLINIMSGTQDTADGKDITTLMGKVAVSLAYVHEQNEHHTAWNGAADTAAATNLMHAVTSDPSTVLTGVKNAESLIANHA
ncbi:MAG: Calx-beta domain-containing protein [Reyranellaceae bacterium]